MRRGEKDSHTVALLTFPLKTARNGSQDRENWRRCTFEQGKKMAILSYLDDVWAVTLLPFLKTV